MSKEVPDLGKAKLPWRRDFGQVEIGAELNIMPGRPHPRETRSQKAQLRGLHQHGTRKDVKWDMSKKLT